MIGDIKMAVTDIDTIDAMGLVPNSPKKLDLLISDHLDWKDEYEHLTVLQTKINLYLAFIENKEFIEKYPNSNFSEFEIIIQFLHTPTANCKEFILYSNKHVGVYGIRISAIDSSDTNP
jgi:hypothetical protein